MAEHTEPRCSSHFDEVRCTLPLDHDGDHENHGAKWSTDEDDQQHHDGYGDCVMAEHTWADVWRAVAIALMSDLADRGAGPFSPAVRAYNHARNGRMAEAREALS